MDFNQLLYSGFNLNQSLPGCEAREIIPFASSAWIWGEKNTLTLSICLSVLLDWNLIKTLPTFFLSIHLCYPENLPNLCELQEKMAFCMETLVLTVWMADNIWYGDNIFHLKAAFCLHLFIHQLCSCIRYLWSSWHKFSRTSRRSWTVQSCIKYVEMSEHQIRESFMRMKQRHFGKQWMTLRGGCRL